MAEDREILVTNGIGGYASMTLANSLTRSYHGLLIAALRPPLDRTLLLSKLDEFVLYLGNSYMLSRNSRKEDFVTNQTIWRSHNCQQQESHGGVSAESSYTKSVGGSLGVSEYTSRARREDVTSTAKKFRRDIEGASPSDFELPESVRLEGSVPMFLFRFGDAELEKKIWMKRGQNTVYVTYHLRRASEPLELRLEALVNFRNHHSRTNITNLHFSHSINVDGSSVSVLFTTAQRKETTLRMLVSRGRAELHNEWVTGLYLSEERARGLPEFDDNLHTATFLLELAPGEQVTFVATCDQDPTLLNLDGEAELEMQHAYDNSILQKYKDTRCGAFQRTSEANRRQGLEVLVSPTSKSSPAVPLSTQARRKRPCTEMIVNQLVLAADQFIISRREGKSIIAGFPWFTDWARDVSVFITHKGFCVPDFKIDRRLTNRFTQMFHLRHIHRQ